MTDVRDWIFSHASRRPDALAQVDHATGRTFTYAQMQERVSRLAGYLRHDLAVGEGDVIAVLGENSSDMFDIDFACARVGAVVLPMNTRLAPPELAYQLDDAEPRAVFVGGGHEASCEAAIAQSRIRPEVLSFGSGKSKIHLEEAIGDAQSPIERSQRSASEGWNLMYSSGTTGRPKGVLHTHGGVTQQAIANCVPLGLSPQSCGLGILPIFHISGLNIFAHAMFYAGGTQVTMARFDPAEVLRVVADSTLGVTHFAGVPTMFEMMAAMPGFADFRPAAIEGVFVGGAPSTRSLLESYAAKSMPLIQGYGLTETGPTLTVLDPEDAIARLGSAGKPIMHVDVRVVRDDGTEAEPDEVGEIIVKGPSVIREYFKRPDAQTDYVLDDWLQTGDMGRFDADGYLYIADRKKDMFISGGENVYPAEVENCLASHAAIGQVSVIGVADEKWGEVGAAFVVPSGSEAITAEDVQAFCDGRLARYKIPRHVFIRESLPLGASGKVLKTELRKLAAELC
ncbi:MAG: long-chain fatty acid--CoA ligase [Pseudomonadota bacterium]